MKYQKTQRIQRIQRIALVFLTVAGVINYLDRSTLSIANLQISQELGLDAVQMGWLLSAFSLSYAFAQLPVGALLDRLGARFMLGVGLFFWSLAQFAGGMIHSYKPFIISRLILGIGEAPQFPAGAKAFAEWYNVRERGKPMGIFNSSSSIGPALAPPLLTALMVSFGWRWMFMIMGIAGIFVAIGWYAIYRNRDEVELTKEEEDYLNDGQPVGEKKLASLEDYIRLFTYPSTWGILLGFMGVVYMVFLYLTWLPGMLQKEYGITLIKTGWLAAIPYVFAIGGTVSAGFVADGLLNKGYPLISSRKSLVAFGLVGAGLFTVPAAYASSAEMAVAFISIAQFFLTFASGSSWILVTSIIPSRQTSSLGGIQNFGGYLAGAAAPAITGYIVQGTGSFRMALIVSAVVALVAALAHFSLVNKPIGTRE